MKRVRKHWKELDHQEKLLRYVQPFLVGFVDGALSTIAPVLAVFYLSGPRAALLVGLAASFSAGLSMTLAESISDDGKITGRGPSAIRGMIVGIGTFIGGILHVLPFLFHNSTTAITTAYIMIALELFGIAWIRKRYMDIPIKVSLIQVTLGGIIIAIVGFTIGHA